MSFTKYHCWILSRKMGMRKVVTSCSWDGIKEWWPKPASLPYKGSRKQASRFRRRQNHQKSRDPLVPLLQGHAGTVSISCCF